MEYFIISKTQIKSFTAVLPLLLLFIEKYHRKTQWKQKYWKKLFIKIWFTWMIPMIEIQLYVRQNIVALVSYSTNKFMKHLTIKVFNDNPMKKNYLKTVNYWHKKCIFNPFLWKFSKLNEIKWKAFYNFQNNSCANVYKWKKNSLFIYLMAKILKTCWNLIFTVERAKPKEREKKQLLVTSIEKKSSRSIQIFTRINFVILPIFNDFFFNEMKCTCSWAKNKL